MFNSDSIFTTSMIQYPESTRSGIILLYYLVASLVATACPPKHELKLRKNSQRLILWTTASNLAVLVSLCVAEVIEIRSRGDTFEVKTINDSLLSDLLLCLQWLVLLLAHVDHPGDVRYPHYGVWILSIVLRFDAPDRPFHSKPLWRSAGGKFVLSLMGTHSLLSFLLFTTTVFLQLAARRAGVAVNDGETQPLLANNESNNKTKNADEEEEQNNRRESPEQKKARQEIHDRPLREYLKSFHIYIPLLWPDEIRQKLYFAGMCVCMLLLRVVKALKPLALGAIIDTLAAQRAPWLPIAGYFTLYFVESNTGLGLLEDYLHLLTSNHQKLTLSRAAYNHVMDLSADFQDSKTSSEIWQAMSQSQSVIDLYYNAGFEVAPLIIDLCTGFVLIWAIFGAYMGFLIMTLVVLMVWVCVHSVQSRVNLARSWRDSWYDSYHQMVDSTENWYTAAQFSRISYEKASFSTKQATALEGRNKLAYWNYRASAQRFSILTFAYLLAAALAALAIYNGELGVGAFAMLTGYWSQVASPIMYIVHEITAITDKLVDAEKLLVLFEKKPTITEAEDATSFTFMGGGVEFENVSFTYNGKKNAAEGISFRSAPGKMTALVGETGGGKSTLLKLLMRFYDPEKGRVLLDGQDVRYLQLDSLRKHIAVVPQEPSMFHTTILDNVRYADPSILEDEVQEACKAVSLHDKIMTFPKGYGTKVGERGCQLSGGEKQRLAIARAILKKPSILLLDEATSSVDSVTEEQIQKSLGQVCKNRSTFVIAHRLSTILKADQILVIQEGKLVESGTHFELVKKHGGAYHKLWKSQLKLQGERSRSRSRSKPRGPEQSPTLIDNVGDAGDVASLVDEADTPPEESTAQTPEDEASADRGRRTENGFSVAGVSNIVFESIRSRFTSRSPDPKTDGNEDRKLVGKSQTPAGSLEKPSKDQLQDAQQNDGTADASSTFHISNRRMTQSDPEIRCEGDAE